MNTRSVLLAAVLAPSLHLMIDRPPQTLNPRAALDATGQRLGALIFRALTRINADLVPVGDLASEFKASHDGKTWTFKIKDTQVDQAGATITPQKIAACLEEYRQGKPISALRAAFISWKTTHSTKDSVQLELDKPDPYLARNLSLVRYFTNDGVPCKEPTSWEHVVASGSYKPEPWDMSSGEPGHLEPKVPGRKPVDIRFVRDDSTRALLLLRGDVDVSQNSLSLSKERWITEAHSDQFAVLERPGVNVSYLAFNVHDPLLSDVRIREAISHAVPRKEIVEHKMFGFGTVAGSLLSPMLAESHPVEFTYDPVLAEKLLDQAGYSRKNGVRFELRYRTTPVREGLETGLMVQDALRKIGIEVKLDVVEPAVFLSAIYGGRFQLYSSIWIGVADASILYRTLYSTQPNNRVKYKDAEMDRLLDQAVSEPVLAARKPVLDQIQEKMMRDLPYFPLYYWSNAVVVRKPLDKKIDPTQLSLSGALDPLLYMLSQ